MQPSALAFALALAGAIACAGPGGGVPARAPEASARVSGPAAREAAARTAISMVGARYRYSGASPAGFDCSGLVVYSYGVAGVSGLPHSAARLEQLARPIPVRDLEPGDLLFFRISGKKTSHVAIYVGDRSFVHAPSGGKRVDRVSFDHVYWGPRIARAGRLEL